ncbi:MAG: class I SAM-dependent methyltransferase [Deltaproteobacteria bacterium]|nr:class I SAM-dependent methyltransferase [Deltaproteobacteria bacterium]
MDLSRKSEHKENSKAWWDEKYSLSSDYLYSKEPSSFLMEQLDLLPSGAKILEIACGEGRNTVALAAKGYSVTAFDFSAKALERAEALTKASGVSVTFKSLDLDFYLPELLSFDAIIGIQFKPPQTLLKNLSRGLKQNGHLILEAPLMESSRTYKNIESFECFKPNELLYQFIPSQQMTFQIRFYSELGPKYGENVYMVAKKSQLL